MKTEIQGFQNTVIKALAIVGLITLIALGSFATISVIRMSGSVFSYLATAAVSLSSIFIPHTEELELNADSYTLKSGEILTLSWENKSGDIGGSYAFEYPCLDGFYFKAVTAANGTETVFCNTPFNFVNIDNTLTLIPVSMKNRYVDMPVIISFTENNTDEISLKATLTITVTNEEQVNSIDYIGSQTENPETAPRESSSGNSMPSGTETNRLYTIPENATPIVDDPNGKADLNVSVLEVGVVDKVTNAFAGSTTLKRSDRIGIRFAVENIGTKSSGEWRFNAILPTFPPYTFNSEAQQTLRPGDRIEYTIGFDQAIEGNQIVKLVIDPQGKISEFDEDNNVTEVTITVL